MSGRLFRLSVLVATIMAAGPLAAWARYADGAGRGATAGAARNVKVEPPKAPMIERNPLLPSPILPSGFFPELSVIQKVPTIAPAGFEPLYSGEEWQEYRTRFAAEADDLAHKKSTEALAFANKLIDAAQKEATARPGLARLLLIRAAAVCYRNRDGFATANKAVDAYQKRIDIRSPAQVGALWTISNAMSRLAVTPKLERLRYSGIATRANTQLALLLLEADQIEAAQSVIKLVGYHEGYVRGDPALRGIIAQTRSEVHQTAAMMDYLATQYRPAIKGDDAALMALYIYGRFVKDDASLVADFPSRKPSSPMAQLAGDLAAAQRDPTANYAAAETLRVVASTLPEGVLRQRALYGALERYRLFIKAPETAKERVKRTLSQMAIEAVIADGARRTVSIHPFEPKASATANDASGVAAESTTQPVRARGAAVQ